MSATNDETQDGQGSVQPSDGNHDRALPIGAAGWQPAPNAPGRSIGGVTVYERLGAEPFWMIARAFYARIDTHASLRPMFPKDLTEAIRNQAEFLIQYFGGPTTYSDRKGHPRLRMRHAHFHIDAAARDAWLDTMRLALDDAQIPAPERAEMVRYFEHSAAFLQNAE
jgi:hemoglobin